MLLILSLLRTIEHMYYVQTTELSQQLTEIAVTPLIGVVTFHVCDIDIAVSFPLEHIFQL